MSSVSHCKVQTINKAALMNAAKDLNLPVSTIAKGVNIAGVTFEFTGDSVNISHYDDVAAIHKSAKNLTQLSVFYTMKDRMSSKGFNLTNSTKDVVTAVKLGQSVNLEFEAIESKVTV